MKIFVEILPWILVILVPALSYVKKAFTLGAALSAIVLLAIIAISGNGCLYVIVFSFFLIALVEKIVKTIGKSKPDLINKKSGPRDVIQLFANGGAALVLSIILLCTGSKLCVFGFVAATAEALGDSSASAIGSSSKGKVVDICRREEVPKGLSGGISLWGSLSCIMACIIVAFFAVAIGLISSQESVCIIISSCICCFLDSVLGSCVQVKYRCKKCGAITEKEIHCDEETGYYSGIKFIDNDCVNAICNVFSGGIAIALVCLPFSLLVSGILYITIAIALIWLASAAHELGHALGCIVSGSKISAIHMTPFIYLNGKLSTSFLSKEKNCCIFQSPSGRKAIMVYLSGPIVNLLFGIFFLIYMLAFGGKTVCILGMAINTFKFMSNIIPRGNNDGRAIHKILSETEVE